MSCILAMRWNKVTPKFEDFQAPSSGITGLDSSSFRNASRYPIYLAQMLAMVPFQTDSFRWYSLRVVAAFIILCGQIVMVVMTLLWVNREGLTLFKVGCIFFFSGAAIMMLLMIRLAFKWPKLIKKWNEIESYFGYQEKLKIIFVMISTTFTVLSTDLALVGIFNTSSSTRVALLETYAMKTFPQIFGVMDYKMWRAIPIVYVNAVSILLYSFGDQLIIMVSLALKNYFNIFNREAQSLRLKSLSKDCWKILRRRYIKLCELCSVVDDCFCHLLCLTFVMHLYILCVTMQQGFFYETDGWEKIHAVLAFTTTTLRAFGLCYTTVGIYEESKTILDVLYAVPSSSYCTEVELFIQQVLENEVILTGSHVFSMKRKFLLTIGGVIVSSQILLIQMKDFKPS